MAKRFKRDEEEVPPSPVLHVRSLPLDVSDYEVRALMPNPQQVHKCMVLRGKGQAFVQFVDVNAAAATLSHFETHRAQVRCGFGAQTKPRTAGAGIRVGNDPKDMFRAHATNARTRGRVSQGATRPLSQ